MENLQVAQQCAEALPQWLWLAITFAVPGVAAHLDAWIRQPGPGSIWLLVRKPLSVIAGNYGWAKNADQETLAQWWATNRQAFFAWLISSAGKGLEDEVAKIIAERQAQASPAVEPAPAPATVEAPQPEAPTATEGSQP